MDNSVSYGVPCTTDCSCAPTALEVVLEPCCVCCSSGSQGHRAAANHGFQTRSALSVWLILWPAPLSTGLAGQAQQRVPGCCMSCSAVAVRGSHAHLCSNCQPMARSSSLAVILLRSTTASSITCLSLTSASAQLHLALHPGPSSRVVVGQARMPGVSGSPNAHSTLRNGAWWFPYILFAEIIASFLIAWWGIVWDILIYFATSGVMHSSSALLGGVFS